MNSQLDFDALIKQGKANANAKRKAKAVKRRRKPLARQREKEAAATALMVAARRNRQAPTILPWCVVWMLNPIPETLKGSVALPFFPLGVIDKILDFANYERLMCQDGKFGDRSWHYFPRVDNVIASQINIEHDIRYGGTVTAPNDCTDHDPYYGDSYDRYDFDFDDFSSSDEDEDAPHRSNCKCKKCRTAMAALEDNGYHTEDEIEQGWLDYQDMIAAERNNNSCADGGYAGNGYPDHYDE